MLVNQLTLYLQGDKLFRRYVTKLGVDFDYYRNGITINFAHRGLLRAVQKYTINGINRIYSCLTNSFQLSRVTRMKFPRNKVLCNSLQNYAPWM